MQNKTKKIKFVISVFFLVLIFVCSSFLTSSLISSLNVQNKQLTKKESLLKSSLTPDFFVLSTDADPIDRDGSFMLTWESSLDVISYSIFVSNNYITEINLDCTQIVTGLEIQNQEIEDLPTGNYYFAVVAYNEYGNTLSNCIHVNVGRIPTQFVLTTDGGNPDEDGIFYLNWTASLYANSYSIYKSDATITRVNDSLILIAQGFTFNSYLINTNSNGHYYYIAIAYNDYGNTSSNSVDILVNIPDYFSLNDLGNINNLYSGIIYVGGNITTFILVNLIWNTLIHYFGESFYTLILLIIICIMLGLW